MIRNKFTSTIVSISSAAALVMSMLVVLTFFEAASQGASQKSKKNQSTAPGGALAPDKGKLKILLDGKQVASEEFEISPSGDTWLARGTTEIEQPGSKHTRVSSNFKLRADGTPQSYEWSAQGEKKASGKVSFQGGVATVQLDIGGSKPFDEEHTFGSPLIAILDNNLYHHYALLARLYDWNKKGKQIFPVLIPQDITPGTIEIEILGRETVGGSSYETLKLTTADIEVNLYLDAAHRLMRLAVPASKVSVVRE